MKPKNKRKRRLFKSLKLDIITPLTVDECWNQLDDEASLPDGAWQMVDMDEAGWFLITRRCSLWSGEVSPTGPFNVDFQGRLDVLPDGTRVVGTIVDDGAIRSTLYKRSWILTIVAVVISLHVLAFLIMPQNAALAVYSITGTLLFLGIIAPGVAARSQARALVDRIEECLYDDLKEKNYETQVEEQTRLAASRLRHRADGG